MSLLKLPSSLTNTEGVHAKWLQIVQAAQYAVADDMEQQNLTAKGIRIKERAIAPEILGRSYSRYCYLINQMYDAYLNNVHLQRATYIQEIINICMKRLYELRNELVHLIVNDYVYVDAALVQLQLTPYDIQIIIPYHLPLECRTDSVEKFLQKLWAEAVRRKNKGQSILDIQDQQEPQPTTSQIRASWAANTGLDDNVVPPAPEPPAPAPAPQQDKESEDSASVKEKLVYEPEVPTASSLATVIQQHERYRQWLMSDIKGKAAQRRLYFMETAKEAPEEVKHKAANIIEKVHRHFMKMKRERVKEARRDILLGIKPDPFKPSLSYLEENIKVYERRKMTRLKINQSYLKELEKENTRIIMFRKGNQIDDITDEIRNWFKEWFYGYGFFPEYPYEIEGGTILVVRGDYPTIEEKQELDEKTLKETKGKTKEQMKEERARLKEEQKMKAQLAKETKRKEEENMVKARCNPFSDPGYQIQESAALPAVNEALIGYRAAWSLFDELPKEKFGETIYGYMKPLLTEDLMKSMHLECRKVIDEMMRLDLKLLIQKHQADFKSMGRKFPKIKPRKKPKAPPVPKPIIYDKKLIKQTAPVFDLNLVTKPTAKLSDVYGDLNYAAYNFNIRDPNATFPFPAYGDIKDRLRLSCVLGCGIQDGATRRKSVMLLGPERNGKQFLVDAVAGELNAIKIDITPEVFTAVVHKPLKVLTQVFTTARAFQPAVIFMKNVERVFAIKVPPEDKYLKAQSLKTALAKQIKQISADDKIIFIGTCSNPWAARAKPMMSIFDEILIVPRTDYGTLSQFLQTKLLNIRSIPRDYCVQSMAQVLRGYSFGDIITAFEEVMTPERLVRLNVTPLSPGEILEALLQKGLEPMDVVDFQKYVDFSIENGPLKTERENYAKINLFREDFYKKEAKKKGEKEKEAAANT